MRKVRKKEGRKEKGGGGRGKLCDVSVEVIVFLFHHSIAGVVGLCVIH